MNPILLDRYGGAVPRYTSYPTAPHFHGGIDAGSYREWLGSLNPGERLSLYLHVPFCREMCWYCGCHTKIVQRDGPLADYAAVLRAEAALVSDALRQRPRLSSLHWGGGTPTLLAPKDFLSVMARLRADFSFTDDAELAVEIDPRSFTPEMAETLGAAGINRASLGVQDFNARVQAAINRVQPYEVTARAVASLKDQGIKSINFDLMYGLPHQGVSEVLESVELAVTLRPSRLALFGYAHVPWMKKHQRLIDEAALPDSGLRARQFEAAAIRLKELGYQQIGLDHFALADDSLAIARRCGRLQRNFQGYTTDSARVLLGLGASAIGSLPEGYVQNDPAIGRYAHSIRAGRFATVRGIRLKTDDHLRRAVIEALMCTGEVDLDVVRQDYGMLGASFDRELASLLPLARDGIVEIEGLRIRVTEVGRPFLRAAASHFDRYLEAGEARHSQAV